MLNQEENCGVCGMLAEECACEEIDECDESVKTTENE